MTDWLLGKQRQTAKDNRIKRPLVTVLGFCFAFLLLSGRIPIPRNDAELLFSKQEIKVSERLPFLTF